MQRTIDTCERCGGPLRQWLSPHELAARYRIDVRTVMFWRQAGFGPKAWRVGGKKCAYAMDGVNEWERALHRYATTSAEVAGLTINVPVDAEHCGTCGRLPRAWEHPAELASRLGLSAKTLGNWRTIGGGPPFSRLSPRRPIYWCQDVHRWQAGNNCCLAPRSLTRA